MTTEQLKERFRIFTVRVLKITDHLPKQYSASVISNQITRSATSSGANYRAACRSKSPKDFINKMKIVEEELDETEYWLQLIEDMQYLAPGKLTDLISEVNELLSITVRSIVTSKKNQRDKGIGD